MTIKPPSLDKLPQGAARSLVEALHELYRLAGKPGTRRLSDAIRKRDDLPDTVSHQTIAEILHGRHISTWHKLECLVRQLTEWSVDHPDTDSIVRHIHSLWLEANEAASSLAAVESMNLLVDMSSVGLQAETALGCRTLPINAALLHKNDNWCLMRIENSSTSIWKDVKVSIDNSDWRINQHALPEYPIRILAPGQTVRLLCRRLRCDATVAAVTVKAIVEGMLYSRTLTLFQTDGEGAEKV